MKAIMMRTHVAGMLLLLIVARPSNADFIQVAQETVSTGATSWSSTVLLPQFDPGLGTLTRIEGFLGGDVYAFAEFENADPARDDFMDVSASAALTVGTSLNSNRLTSSIGDFSSVAIRHNNTGSQTAFFSGDSAGLFFILDNDPEFSAFIGAGTVGLDVNVVNLSSAEARFGIASLQSFETFSRARITLNYFFDQPVPVPEPATLALLAIGLAGVRRTRRRQNA